MSLSLKAASYELHLQAIDTLIFPRYKGSSLRGGFGSTFKKLTCCQPNISCDKCLVSTSCPYHYVFETSPPIQTQLFAGYSSVPRPFVIEPPLGNKDVFESGEELKIGLILVGKAVEYLPYFIVVFQSLGMEGIGKGRGRFAVTKVTAPYSAGREVYSGEGVIDQEGTAVELLDFKDSIRNMVGERTSLQVKLEFQTPLRLVKEGKLQDKVDFGLFFRALIRRISSLTYFHGDEEIPLDEVRELISKAAEVGSKANFSWYDWERYSNRQKERMKLGGVIGEMVIADLPIMFLPWVLMGALVHVGKGATFGLGKYRVQQQ